MTTLDLNGLWDFSFLEGKFLEDVENAPELPLAETMCVPGCFDALPKYYCRRGCAVYARNFVLEETWENGFLRIDGMGLRSRFYLDGQLIGSCALPYSAFELETGRLAAGPHRLVALADNDFDPEKMKLFRPGYDFYAFGGFYHGISLRLSRTANPPDRIRIRTADFRTGRIELAFLFKHETPAKFEAKLAIDGEEERIFTVSGGVLELTRQDLQLWAPETPCLHTLRASVAGERLTETFGLREIRTEGNRILLNGKEIYLKGFNRHEAGALSGAATTEQEMLADLLHLKSLGANFIRGSHYPQAQVFLDLCDRLGILVWEESLGWGNPAEQMSDPEFIAAQVEQTRLMVHNSFNHPSVIIFAFLNENASGTDEGVALCRKLAETIRAEKSGRLVTFACSHIFDDRACAGMDIVSFNTYPGWITADCETDPEAAVAPHVRKIVDHFLNLYGKTKPIIVSEMGCCGLYGQHDEAGAQWSEEFQAGYLAAVFDAVAASPEITGLTLWQFNDAKSYHRTGSSIRCKPLAQNLAGVYDIYRRPKLAAQTAARKFAGLGEPPETRK